MQNSSLHLAIVQLFFTPPKMFAHSAIRIEDGWTCVQGLDAQHVRMVLLRNRSTNTRSPSMHTASTKKIKENVVPPSGIYLHSVIKRE